MNARIDPPEHGRQDGGGEDGCGPPSTLQELPRDERDRDEDQRLLRERDECEADEGGDALAAQVSGQGRDDECRGERLRQVVDGREQQPGVERDEEPFPAGASTGDTEPCDDRARHEQGGEADGRERRRDGPGLAGAENPAEPAVQRVSVPVGGVVEAPVHLSGRQRIDGDPPVELAVVRARMHRVEARVDFPGGV